MTDLKNFVSDKSISYRTEPFVQFACKMFLFDYVFYNGPDHHRNEVIRRFMHYEYFPKTAFEYLNKFRWSYDNAGQDSQFKKILDQFTLLLTDIYKWNKNFDLKLPDLPKTKEDHEKYREAQQKMIEYGEMLNVHWNKLQEYWAPIESWLKDSIERMNNTDFFGVLDPMIFCIILLLDNMVTLPRKLCKKLIKQYALAFDYETYFGEPFSKSV
jgi:hypothetical protein